MLRGPWIVAGDRNLNPAVLRESGFLEICDGVIVATSLPTCNENTYDYFVVARRMIHAVAGVTQLSDTGITPHFQTRLILKTVAMRSNLFKNNKYAMSVCF